jgi:hypothetical protein
MVVEILGHRGGFLGELEIPVALDMVSDSGGHLAAVDRAQRLPFPDCIAYLRAKIDHLTREGRQHPCQPILVKLHLAGNDERSGHGVLADDLHLDGSEHR